MEAGPARTAVPMPVEVEFPDEPLLHLRISVGACRLRITPAGNGGKWVTGTYEDPTLDMPYRVTREGGTVRIAQKQGLGTLKSPFQGAPSMNLELGRARPYSLAIESGASDSSVDLGGLPITLLAIKKGAGKAEFDFSAPNPEPMDQLDIDAGAVSLVLRHLANANFTTMRLDGGAAAYDLDFGGQLSRDAAVTINAGVSSVKVSVPATTAARITPGSVLGSLHIGDGLLKKEGAFWTEAAVAGQSPTLSIVAHVALGSLAIRVTPGTSSGV